MSYLSTPAPAFDEISAPFWAHCAERRLCFQSCGDCGHLAHPPIPICPHCRSLNRQWRSAPDAASVFSFVWVHTAAHASVRDRLPYNVVLVEFPELPGIRLVSNVIDVQRGELAIGDALTLAWEEGGDGQMLPRFRRKGSAP